MLLAIDAGNTNVVFALFEGEQCLGQFRCATDRARTGDEYAVWLTQIMALKGFEPVRVTAAVLCSVVPAATYNLKRMIIDHFGRKPLVVGEPDVDLGIRVLIDRPEQVGVDRLANCVAAKVSYAGAVIAIDFGTGTSFDVIDADGNFCGGVIAPGINLSLEALIMAAPALPRVPVVQPARVIGKDTVSAIQSGIFWGYVGLIEGLVARIRAEFGDAMTVVGTGGLAPLFAKATPVIQRIDGDLTLRGLRLIHQQNCVA